MYYDELDWRASDCDYKILYRPGVGESEVSEFAHSLKEAHERLNDLQTFSDYCDFMLFRWTGEEWEEIRLKRLNSTDLLLHKMDAEIQELKKQVDDLGREIRSYGGSR